MALGKLDTIQELDEAAATNMMHSSTDQDTRTVFSGAASLLQNPDVGKYISAFANEPAGWVPPEFVTGDPAEVTGPRPLA